MCIYKYNNNNNDDHNNIFMSKCITRSTRTNYYFCYAFLNSYTLFYKFINIFVITLALEDDVLYQVSCKKCVTCVMVWWVCECVCVLMCVAFHVTDEELFINFNEDC